jgi:stage V sporulation protein G
MEGFIMNKNENAPTTVPENLNEQTLTMKVDVKIGAIRSEGSVKAIASVNLNGCLAIRNVKVMDSIKGLFVAMPSYKASNGEYKDICFPVTKGFRDQLNSAVMDAYQQALSQTQNAASEQVPGIRMGGM